MPVGKSTDANGGKDMMLEFNAEGASKNVITWKQWWELKA